MAEPLSGYNTLFSGSEPIENDVKINGPVEIHALPGNGGIIYVGSSDVDDTNGYPLAAGEALRIAFIANLNQLYYYSSSPQGISWMVRRL